MAEIDEYWQAVQNNVCARCIDGDGRGSCCIASTAHCGLRYFFPEIVNTVLSVQSESLGPYVKALRQNVCSMCEHQSADGSCNVRADIDCGLDRYFPMIVESIEGFRPGLTAHGADYAGAQ